MGLSCHIFEGFLAFQKLNHMTLGFSLLNSQKIDDSRHSSPLTDSPAKICYENYAVSAQVLAIWTFNLFQSELKSRPCVYCAAYRVVQWQSQII